jgi:hypothetical protein
MLLAASSPYAKKGSQWNAYSRHHGKDGDAILTWQAASKVMNPTIPAHIIEEARADDPEAALSEWDAQFRSDVSSFIDPEVVRACVDSGCRERPFEAGKRYSAFVDPSGGSSDSMTMGIGHREGEITVLDVLRENGAPFDPTSVVTEFAAVLKGYNIRSVCGDRYAAQWCSTAFEKCGIRYEHSPLNRSEIYLETLPVLNAKRVRLIDNARLVSQLSNLERRTSRGGRDSIDHPPSGRDDVANAACGMIATMRKGPSVTVEPLWNFFERLNSDNYNQDGKFVGPPPRVVPHPTRGLPSWMR